MAPLLFEYDEDEYGFDGNVIQRMELLVLKTLDWKMSCITPFTYLNYFANVFCFEVGLEELMNRAFELILAIMAGDLSTYTSGFLCALEKLNSQSCIGCFVQRLTWWIIGLPLLQLLPF